MSQHINLPKSKNHSYYQMIKIIVNLDSKKGDNNEKSSPQLYHLHNS